MLRINLLPREILDKHRYSRWYRFVFIVAAGVGAALLLVALGLSILVQQKAEELQVTHDLVAQYQEQGKAFDVFEKKENELNDRQAIVQLALANRVNLGKVAEETSLILPDEVWVDSLSLDEAEGLTFTGNTPRSSSQSLSQSYKSVARTLVRLNQLPQITDVWLIRADNSAWSRWDTASVLTTTLPVVQFQVSAKVLRSSSASGTLTVDGR